MEDKQLTCKKCGQEWTWEAAEQEFFARKGFKYEPSCHQCRAQKKAMIRNDYEAVCSQCGQKCFVPFNPSPDKPVYCSTCYAGIKASK